MEDCLKYFVGQGEKGTWCKLTPETQKLHNGDMERKREKIIFPYVRQADGGKIHSFFITQALDEG
jgi:hypothetical protein